MGSKTSVSTTDITKNDASTLNAITGTRIDGDKNVTTITDGESVKNALLFAQRNSDGTFKTTSDVLGLTDSLADKIFKATRESTQDALKVASEGRDNAIAATTSAFTSAANSGIKPEVVLMVIAALGAIVMLMKR